MANQDRTSLKGFFETGDVPTEQQFADLIESQLNRKDDDIDRAVASMAELVNDTIVNTSALTDGATVLVHNFYSDTDGGGDPFRWDADGDKANHNGITIIDPTHSTTPGNSGWWTSENTGTTGVFRRRDKSYINIKDAGAKVDGSTDDYNAIQAILDWNGALITSPVGTSNITSRLNINNDGVNWVANKGFEISQQTSATQCLHAEYQTDITIKNIKFIAPNDTSIVEFQVCPNVTIDSCEFEQPQSASNNTGALLFNAASSDARFDIFDNIRVKDCHFNTNHLDVLFQASSNGDFRDIEISGCTINCDNKRSDNGAECLKVDGGGGIVPSGVVITNNKFNIGSNTIATAIIVEQGVTGAIISNNSIGNGTFKEGIHLFHGQSGDEVENYTIIGNVIYDGGGVSGARAISVENEGVFLGGTIQGNSVFNFDGDGIYVYSAPSISITGNIAEDIKSINGDGRAFFVRESAGASITGNSFRNCTGGWRVESSDDMLLSSNNFQETTSASVFNCSNFQFTGNKCKDTQDTGTLGYIVVSQSSGAESEFLFHGNKIETTIDSALWFGSGLSDIKIFDNYLESASIAIGKSGSLGFDNLRATNNVGYVTSNSGIASISDGGAIAHGLTNTTNAVAFLTTTDGTHIASVTNISGSDITVALKDNTGSSVGVAENVYWKAISSLESN